MARERSARRLVANDIVFIWSLRHKHLPYQAINRQCREVLGISRERERGRLEIAFRSDPNHAVGDGCYAGQVGIVDGVWLNLRMPGVVRTLLDEATERGWNAQQPTLLRIDGWGLVDSVASKLENHAGVEIRRRHAV
jgi:hypothetical protein